jgi:hypothetical protein
VVVLVATVAMAAELAVTASLHLVKAASAVATVVETSAVIAVDLQIAHLKVVVSVLRKATVSVIVSQAALLTTLAPQTATFAKVALTTVTAVGDSLHVVIPHRVVTLLRVKNLHHVVTLRLAVIAQSAATSLHVKISPLVVISPHAATLQTVNQLSLSLALPNQRLLSQRPNQAMAAKCLCHVIWRKHAPFALSNSQFEPLLIGRIKTESLQVGKLAGFFIYEMIFPQFGLAPSRALQHLPHIP